MLEDALQHRQSVCEEIPIIINGKEYWTEDVRYQTMVVTFVQIKCKISKGVIFNKLFQPSNHGKKIAKYCYATPVRTY